MSLVYMSATLSSREILMNYAAYCPTMGYNQGMSDLLAPILTVIQNESDTFWCFVGLMNRTIFISTPTDDVMEKQLVSAFRSNSTRRATCSS